MNTVYRDNYQNDIGKIIMIVIKGKKEKWEQGDWTAQGEERQYEVFDDYKIKNRKTIMKKEKLYKKEIEREHSHGSNG